MSALPACRHMHPPSLRRPGFRTETLFDMSLARAAFLRTGMGWMVFMVRREFPVHGGLPARRRRFSYFVRTE